MKLVVTVDPTDMDFSSELCFADAVLSDPTGSSLYNYIQNGELKSEGGSITEGIGSSRVTANFAKAKIDGAFSISDQESLPILYDLIQNEGLSLGTSCGVNIAKY